MEITLLEKLTGRFLSGTSLAQTPRNQWHQQSIADHLTRLFNVRQGSLSYLPDYGLPDPVSIYRDQPHAIEELEDAMRTAMERYEPRMRQISVRAEPPAPYAACLTFVLSGKSRCGDLIQLHAVISPVGAVRVSPV